MYDEEAIYCAEIERSLNAVAEAWGREDITVEEMVEQLEELVAVTDGESCYNRLITKFSLRDLKDS